MKKKKKKMTRTRRKVTPFDRKKDRLLMSYKVLFENMATLLRLNRDTLTTSVRILDREGIDDIFSLNTIQRENSAMLAKLKRLDKRSLQVMEELLKDAKEKSDTGLGDECSAQSNEDVVHSS